MSALESVDPNRVVALAGHSKTKGEMNSRTELDPNTPVIVGVGQATERVDDTDYQGLSPLDLAQAAARAAALDTKAADPAAVIARIDTIATTRQFDSSTPGAQAPLGKSTKFPVSLANRLGVQVRRAILEVAGGQSPQQLVIEFCREIANGHAQMVLIAGAEAISTIRMLAKRDDKPDFSDDPDDPNGVFEDRGYGLRGLVTMEQAAHGLTDAPTQYALLENARRAALGMGRTQYREDMARLFAPFSQVAASNSFSAVRERHSVSDLATVNDRNRLIADPYPRFLVSRDQVNQGAAVLLTSVENARHLGIQESRWVFLHGQAALTERTLLDRPSLNAAPAAPAAVKHALEVAGLEAKDIEYFDFYSCFPIAVTNIIDALKISPDDRRGLTLTGGLPFFGGAGNNYSMHAIAEAVSRVRETPGKYALVSANGGILSKTSVGVYGTIPTELRPDASTVVQSELDSCATPHRARRPTGWATIESYTLKYQRNDKVGIVVGRLNSNDSRFVAQVADGDDKLLARLEADDQPIGSAIYVTAFGSGNRVTSSDQTAARLFPPANRTTLLETYEHVSVRRDGRVLEITINRPDVRNCLHPPAHLELEQIFDVYFADPDLWVAIITGAGEKAFCAGNDLIYSAGGKLPYLPPTGFAGLTGRRHMHKPVIAAVNGYAMGGGFETALACHLVVADETAQFALSEVKVGLVAGAGGVVRLPRLIPAKIATELILTGRRISAGKAHELGVVNCVAPQGLALTRARELAAEIVSGSPTSVRLSLGLMDRAQAVGDAIDAMESSDDLIDELMTSADAHEGMRAFAMKEAPRWQNQ